MTAPKPNITLSDGTRHYLPPDARTYMVLLQQAGEEGLREGRPLSISRLERLGLIEGVQQRGVGWRWWLTEHGKKVARELADQSDK